MDFHTEFAMVLLFVYAFQNWGPFTNIHSNIQIHTHKRTYKLISWNQNIRIAHCMYRNRFIFNECISFIINDWKTWYPTVWYISFLLSSIIFLPQLKWPHAHFLSQLSGYCRWRLHLCCNYNYCIFSKQIIRSICFQIGWNLFYTFYDNNRWFKDICLYELYACFSA